MTREFLPGISRILLILFFTTTFLACSDSHDDPAPPIDGPKHEEWNVPPVIVPTDLSPGITLERANVRTLYNKIKDVPWGSLQPGDIVYLTAGVYNEKIVLSESGTSDKWIRVVGVPDGQGNLPVIDGSNANSVSGEHHAAGSDDDLNTRSLISVSNRNGRDGWGVIPQYISIENLEIKNAHPTFKYTIDNGPLVNYDQFTAGIWVDRVDHLVVRNCQLRNCSVGLFVNSKYQGEPNDASISKHILVESNYFYNNGVAGSFYEHNSYIEAIDVVYQYNRYESLVSGATGSTLKDRSAGTVIRYNWMDATARILDLVDSEAGSTIICAEPTYKETFVYGNLFYNGPNGATAPFHYGGDHYNYSLYRKGTLYFYHNTVVNVADQLSEPGRYYTILFSLPDQSETGGAKTVETVDCRNNVFYNVSNTPGHAPTDFYWLFSSGNVNLGKNWVSPNLMTSQTGSSGVITGADQLIIGAGNDPGFTDYKNGDYTLKTSSALLDVAAPLSDYINANYPLNKEYKVSRQFTIRAACGKALDLGALEACN